MSINIIPEERAKLAHDLFCDGYNCAQAVAIAFSDVIGIDKNDVSRLVSGFGGGFGRMREVCGAVSGGVFVLNALYGGFDVNNNNLKAEHYSLIQTFLKEFSLKNGSYICRELLNLECQNDNPIPEKRTEQYYKKRPCAELVGISASITAQLIINK